MFNNEFIPCLDSRHFSLIRRSCIILFQIQDRALGNPDLRTFLKEGRKFDIVVVSVFLASEAGYYLAKKFDSSLVLYSTGQSSVPWMNAALGQPHNPSYMPLPILDCSAEMTFFERLKNFIMTNIGHHGFRDYYILNQVDTLLDKHFPEEERPSLLDMERNAAAGFGFTHPLFLDGWRPTNPNYVHLGMMNCR